MQKVVILIRTETAKIHDIGFQPIAVTHRKKILGLMDRDSKQNYSVALNTLSG